MLLSRSVLNKYGIKLVVVGHRDLLPYRVKAAAEKAENMTKDNDRYARFTYTVEALALISDLVPSSISACHTLLGTRSPLRCGLLSKNVWGTLQRTGMCSHPSSSNDESS